jgi:hypothetical protein
VNGPPLLAPPLIAATRPRHWVNALGRRLFPLSRASDVEAAYLAYPVLKSWRHVFRQLDMPLDAAIRVAATAETQRTSLHAELIANGVEEGTLARAMAVALGVRYLAAVDETRLILRAKDCLTLLRADLRHAWVKTEEADGRVAYVMIAGDVDVEDLSRRLARSSALRTRIRFTTRSALRAALIMRARHLLTDEARRGLVQSRPHMSARTVVTPWQAGIVGACLFALATGLALAFQFVLAAIHLASSLFFLGCVSLRVAAARHRQQRAPPPSRRPDTAAMPRYTVLVALYRETEAVPQLLAALDRLVWPRSKLEVKLVCEQDDRETLEALRAAPLPAHIEIVEVPPSHPRTKPKALAYALPLSTGEFVVLYDAEDMPHPMQLVEAWERFCESDARLACLQAPLTISNAGENLLTLQFAFEYAALFRRVLPWLSSRRSTLPLGGTSNHFRMSALLEAGAWDPYNVTEDADLGLRLTRLGYCNAQDQVARQSGLCGDSRRHRKRQGNRRKSGEGRGVCRKIRRRPRATSNGTAAARVGRPRKFEWHCEGINKRA